MGKNKQAPPTDQLGLFRPATKEEVEKAALRTKKPPRFRSGDPDRIFLGDTPLARYLDQAGKHYVRDFRSFLFEQDMTPFLDKYQRTGRRPYHPFVILGLVLYGTQMGRRSLRELEDLAKMDLGAWWICGGLQPDHSTIGDFIHLHAEVLTETFFLSMTKNLAHRLNASSSVVSGDGTVIEAASSRFSMLKREAAEEAMKRAEQKHGKESAEAKRAYEALDCVTKRDEARVKHGRNKHKAQVCPQEPEAVIQPRKDKVMRPSYKPSVLANEDRLIVGQHVTPANEIAAIRPMLRQYEGVFGMPVSRLLLDAGYASGALFSFALNEEIDLLCPLGALEKHGKVKKVSKSGNYLKGAFLYIEEEDIYRCPRGFALPFLKADCDGNGRSYRVYRCNDCDGCEDRKRCTKSRHGRMVKRYEHEALKEAMCEVLSQKRASQAYSHRKGMVEPVFSVLRMRQNLTRFSRRTLAGVRVEFSLHCMAYNLKRACQLLPDGFGAFSPDSSDFNDLCVLFGVIFVSAKQIEFLMAISTPNAIFLLRIGCHHE